MSRGPKDYYAVLHVQPGAPPEIIKASYRTLMQRLKAHPDLGGEPAVAAEINEAYAVLKDPAKRAAYDAARTATLTAAEVAHVMDGKSVRDPREAQPAAPGRDARRPDDADCPFCGLPQPARHGGSIDPRCTRCSSPQKKLVPRELDDHKSRAYRVAKDEPLRFSTDWREPRGETGVLLDLSLTGLRFAASAPLRNGQVVRIECASFSAVVRVAHCERHDRQLSFQVGAEFVTVQFHKQRGSLVSIPV